MPDGAREMVPAKRALAPALIARRRVNTPIESYHAEHQKKGDLVALNFSEQLVPNGMNFAATLLDERSMLGLALKGSLSSNWIL